MNCRRCLQIFPLLVLLAVSCPAPLTRDILNNVKDEIPPEITITSPEQNSYCANMVEVTGTVSDLATSDGIIGRIDECTYEVSGTSVSGSFVPDAEGIFSFVFPTILLGNNFTLTLNAVDWNGNRTVGYITLQKRDSDAIPSFTATPGNKSVTLEWDPVPFTESYTLYYTTNGSLPSEIMGEKLEGVSSPKTIPDIRNGLVGTFMLKTVPEDGYPESVSDYRQAVTMSGFTLDVRTVPGFGKITVEWNDISAIEKYEIFRASERDGIYYNLSGPISENRYTDTSVEAGCWYFYKVRPYLDGGTLSNYAAGITDPFPNEFPLPAASHSTQGWAEGIVAADGLVFVAEKSDGVEIFDVSDPTSPDLLSHFNTPGYAYAIQPYGSHIVVADSSGGLQIVDVGNPAAPSIVANVLSDESVSTLAIRDNYVFAPSSSDLYVFDISTPELPVQENQIPLSGASDIVLDGDYAYAATGSGVVMVNISDPENPVVETVTTDSDTAGNAIAVINGYAVTAKSWTNTMAVVDISTPSAPVATGTTITLTDSGRDVYASGNYLFVGDNQDGGIQVYDMSTPLSPVHVGNYDTKGACSELAIDGDYLYIADYEGGLQILNIANPSTPRFEGFTDYVGACGIDVQDDYVFIAAWNRELGTFDITDRSNPVPESTAPMTDRAYNLEVRGAYAFVAADGYMGLAAFDVSDPEDPVFLSETETTDDAADVFISGDYAYVAIMGYGLDIIDISDPTALEQVGTCEAVSSWGVVVEGDYAYLADTYWGMRIIDVSDPTSPFIVNTAPISDEATAIAVDGDYAFVADGTAGVVVFDISDPAATLTSVGTYTGIKAVDIEVHGKFAYVADDGVGRLIVLDISDPTDPVLVGSYEVPNHCCQLKVAGYHAYIADDDGLLVVSLFD